MHSRWTSRRRVWWTAAALAGAVGLWIAGGIVLAEVAMRAPRGTPPSAQRGEWPPIAEIRARDGVALHVVPPKSNANCVIVLHGIRASRQSTLGFAPMFTERQYNVLLPDLRGHGESGGDVVTYGVLEADDVRRWVDWLTESQGCHRVYGFGESLGGGILLQSLAVESRFRAVVAECPYASLEEIARDRIAALLPVPKALGDAAAFPFIESAFLYSRAKYGIDAHGASPKAAVRETRTPILLIHGLRDTNTSPQHSREIAAQNSRIELWLVPGAGHMAARRAEPVEFSRRVLGWFEAH